MSSSGNPPLDPVAALPVDASCVFTYHVSPSLITLENRSLTSVIDLSQLGAEPRMCTKAADDSFIREGGRSRFESFATSKGPRGGGIVLFHPIGMQLLQAATSHKRVKPLSSVYICVWLLLMNNFYTNGYFHFPRKNIKDSVSGWNQSSRSGWGGGVRA